MKVEVNAGKVIFSVEIPVPPFIGPSPTRLQIELNERDARQLAADLLSAANKLANPYGLEFGQSGHSISEPVCPECATSPCIGHPAPPQRPLSNKTGRSE